MRQNAHSRARQRGIRDARVTHKAPGGVTQDHWVYLCFAADDRLLYVGVTSCGMRRFAEGHARKASWWSDVAKIEVEHLATRDEAHARERYLIIERKPLHNVVHADGVIFEIPRPVARVPDGTPTRWLPLEELADWLSAEPDWVRAKIKDGMPHAIIAGEVRFQADAVRRWLRS